MALVTTGRLARSIAHDLNNLFQIINGNAELVRLEAPTRRIADAGRNIEEAGQCALRMTQLAVSLSRTTAPPRTELSAHLGRLEPVLTELAGRSVRLTLVDYPRPAWIPMPAPHVDQILINLVVNGKEAGASAIDVQVRHTNVKPGAGQSRWVALDVMDDGRGFSATELRLAAQERFTSNKPQGTGIGLATVHRLVLRAGGEFSLANRQTGGAIATIRLPVE